MKPRTLFFSILMLSLIFLGACEIEGGVYDHLQSQEIGKIHKVDFVNETNDVGTADNTTVFKHLQANLLEGYCSGKFSEEEKNYFELEKRAIIEFDPNVCDELPEEPLVYTCDNQEIVYYSRERCYNYFMEDMI